MVQQLGGHELRPWAGTFSFAAPKRKSTKKKMAPLSPIAPRGQGVALRCYPSALLGDMGLVFLPNGDRSQAIDLSDAIFRFLSFSDHI